jgi:hypothetical protein
MDQCCRLESASSTTTTTTTTTTTERNKCPVGWRTLKRFAPNRGRYDIASARVVNVCKITSALLWFCPGGGARKREEILAIEEESAENCCNYRRKTMENGETVLISRLPFSKTFTKKTFGKRKCRPALRSLNDDEFEEHESFLLAVSTV